MIQDLTRQLSHIPLTRALRVSIIDYTGDALRLGATLKGNTNVHGSAFAGSLYSVSALAGWGLVYLKLHELKLEPRIVIGESNIRFRSEVRSDIEVRSTVDAEALTKFVDELRATKTSSMVVASSIADGTNEAVRFRGTYFASF